MTWTLSLRLSFSRCRCFSDYRSLGFQRSFGLLHTLGLRCRLWKGTDLRTAWAARTSRFRLLAWAAARATYWGVCTIIINGWALFLAAGWPAALSRIFFRPSAKRLFTLPALKKILIINAWPNNIYLLYLTWMTSRMLYLRQHNLLLCRTVESVYEQCR